LTDYPFSYSCPFKLGLLREQTLFADERLSKVRKIIDNPPNCLDLKALPTTVTHTWRVGCSFQTLISFIFRVHFKVYQLSIPLSCNEIYPLVIRLIKVLNCIFPSFEDCPRLPKHAVPHSQSYLIKWDNQMFERRKNTHFQHFNTYFVA